MQQLNLHAPRPRGSELEGDGPAQQTQSRLGEGEGQGEEEGEGWACWGRGAEPRDLSVGPRGINSPCTEPLHQAR